MEKRTLYHGSTDIVERPLVSIGRKDLDFGPGFYLTPLHEQASQWAKRTMTIRKATQAIVNGSSSLFQQTATSNVLMHTTRNGSTLLLIAERANVHGRGMT